MDFTKRCPPYAILTAAPDPQPLNLDAVRDTLTTPLIPRRWWGEFTPIPIVDKFLAPSVVQAFLETACLTGYPVDATCIEISEDPDTGLEWPKEVRYRGLAVFYVEPEYGYAFCANPLGNEPVHLFLDSLTSIRLDPFAGAAELEEPPS